MDYTPWLTLVGHLLTGGAVVISALSLRHALHQHRDTNAREQRNQFTVAAATALAKLERRRQQYLNYFLHVKPHFITASEKFADATPWQTVRDFLWRELEIEESTLQRSLAEDEIEVAYVAIAAFDGSLYNDFRYALTEMDKLAHLHLGVFRKLSQHKLSGGTHTQATATLSTTLRQLSAAETETFSAESESLIAPVRERILLLIQSAATNGNTLATRSAPSHVLRREGDRGNLD